MRLLHTGPYLFSIEPITQINNKGAIRGAIIVEVNNDIYLIAFRYTMHNVIFFRRCENIYTLHSFER